MTVEMKPVTSSNVRAIGYDPATKDLHVTYSNGGTYVYTGVEPHHHEALMGAESVGRHLAAHVKGKFAHRKKDDEK